MSCIPHMNKTYNSQPHHVDYHLGTAEIKVGCNVLVTVASLHLKHKGN